MAVDFGKGTISVVPEVDKARAQAGLQRDLGSTLRSAGKKMALAGGAMTAGLTLPIVALGTSAVQSAAQLEDVSAAADVVFGSASRRVKAFGDDALKNFGITESAAIDAATQFAAFGKAAGLQEGPLAGFSTKLVGLAGDLASFRGTTTEEALTAVGAALRGESEPIRRYGVLLDDMTLRQEAMRLGIVKNVKTALTPQQKVLAAQSAIFKQTGDAQGDFQRTGDSAANTMKVMSGTIEEVKTAFGTALLPVVKAVAGFLTPLLAKFEGLSGGMKTAIIVVLGVVAVGGPLLLIIGAIVTAIGALTVTVGVVIGVIAALIVVGVLLAKNWDAIMAAIRPVIDYIVAAVRPVFEALAEVWRTSILPALKDLWDAIKNIWTILKVLLAVALIPIIVAFKVITKVLPVVIKVAGFLIRVIAGVIKVVSSLVAWVADKLGPSFETALSIARTVFDGIKTGWRAVRDVAVAVWDVIWEAIRTVVNAIAGAWNNTVGSLSFRIPGWVPGLGGKGFDVPDIPTLAAGGIVTRGGLAAVHAAEVVGPLDRIGEMVGAGGGRQELVGVLELTPDSRAFVRGVVVQEDRDGRAHDRTVARMGSRRDG